MNDEIPLTNWDDSEENQQFYVNQSQEHHYHNPMLDESLEAELIIRPTMAELSIEPAMAELNVEPTQAELLEEMPAYNHWPADMDQDDEIEIIKIIEFIDLTE